LAAMATTAVTVGAASLGPLGATVGRSQDEPNGSSKDNSSSEKRRSSISSSSNKGNTSMQNGRHLEDMGATFQYDLSQFSLRFEKCQYVQMFEDDLAEDEDSDTPLATKNFVVYRLCPSDACEKCENYGTYVVEVETYLENTIEYQEEAFEQMCGNCDEACNNDGGYCNGCGKLCYDYNNLEANGYVEASAYYQCQQLDYGDDDDLSLYIGPICASQGNEINIGLFSDENCWNPYTDLDVEDVLGSKLSYLLMSHASTTDDTVCLSCAEVDEDQNEQNRDDDDAEDYDDVNEMCENLYDYAGKCESKTGIANGFIQINREEEDYENQVENEFMACTFIDSLLWNSYTETGEIDIYSEQDVIIREATTLQKATLGIISLGVLALVGSIFYLHRKIERSFPNLTFMGNPDSQIT